MDIKEVVSILLGTQKRTGSVYVVKSYWEITSHRKYFGNLIIFIKKLFEKESIVKARRVILEKCDWSVITKELLNLLKA